MSPCVFCDIVEGKIPAKIAHEDHLAVAFHDVSPKAPVHVLVIPREHVADLDAATPSQELLLGHLLLLAREVADREGLGNGYRVVINRGADGGQTVDHLHLHVLGGRPLSWPPG
ncbi:MAG: histidine triad nucleotide-binding protein [Gemmatimonadota bacterium]|nr:MAG: histidine triad nucleotide-binding protein [Gemmatimonadota bacterium]